MARQCARNGLLLAGTIVTLVGLGIVGFSALGIPREWRTLAVGIALLIAGGLRAALGSRRPDAGAS